MYTKFSKVVLLLTASNICMASETSSLDDASKLRQASSVSAQRKGPEALRDTRPLASADEQFTSLTAWKAFFTQALGSPIDDNTVVSFAGTSTYADLGDDNPNIINGNIHYYGNNIPNNSPIYGIGSSLFDQYSLFLNCIKLNEDLNPNLQNVTNIATQELNRASATFRTVQKQAIAAWITYKQINPTITFAQYTQTQYQEYQTALNAYIGANSRLGELLIQRYGAAYQVINDARNLVSSSAAGEIAQENAYNMPIQYSQYIDGSTEVNIGDDPSKGTPTAGATSYLPRFSMPDFPAIYKQWQSNSVSGQKGGSIAVSSSSTDSAWSETHWTAAADGSISGDFLTLSASGSASGDKTSLNVNTDAFSLKVDFTGLATVPVVPGPWFNPGLIKAYKDSIDPTRSQGIDFFGPNGSLTMIPSKIVLGFEPAISLTLEKTDYSKTTDYFHTEASAGLSVGPFRLGGGSASYTRSSTDIHFDDTSSTVTINPIKSSLPIVLGVISSKL
ncbi:MAG: hypothetical protein Q8S21_06660 [Candidatus Paracaedibacteraceae bacterium]|nr:hypothetical protein [Candidatus Paracaedibacteraceae bacterium]